jgi:hypothetical protein
MALFEERHDVLIGFGMLGSHWTTPHQNAERAGQLRVGVLCIGQPVSVERPFSTLNLG